MAVEVFDPAAFSTLEDHLWTKAEGLRSEYTLSKQVLHCLRYAAKAIRSRAEYLPEVREHLRRADDFEEMLDRLIAGQTRSDRRQLA